MPKINPTLDSRLPIMLPLSEQVTSACENLRADTFSCFQRKLIRAMFALAFLAALRVRVGEMTITGDKSSTNLLLLKQVFFLKDCADSIVGIKLSMRNYKHSDTSRPTDIIVYKDKPVCALALLLDYLNARGRIRCSAGPVTQPLLGRILLCVLVRPSVFRVTIPSFIRAIAFELAPLRGRPQKARLMLKFVRSADKNRPPF